MPKNQSFSTIHSALLWNCFSCRTLPTSEQSTLPTLPWALVVHLWENVLELPLANIVLGCQLQHFPAFFWAHAQLLIYAFEDRWCIDYTCSARCLLLLPWSDLPGLVCWIQPACLPFNTYSSISDKILESAILQPMYQDWDDPKAKRSSFASQPHGSASHVKSDVNTDEHGIVPKGSHASDDAVRVLVPIDTVSLHISWPCTSFETLNCQLGLWSLTLERDELNPRSFVHAVGAMHLRSTSIFCWNMSKLTRFVTPSPLGCQPVFVSAHELLQLSGVENRSTLLSHSSPWRNGNTTKTILWASDQLSQHCLRV